MKGQGRIEKGQVLWCDVNRFTVKTAIAAFKSPSYFVFCQDLSSRYLELAVSYLNLLCGYSNSDLSFPTGPVHPDLRRPVGLLKYSVAAEWGEHGAVHGALP